MSMKKTVKLFGIIALVAVIGFSFITCEQPTDDPAHEHVWGAWSTVTAATCTTPGSETRSCTLDATHKETRDIAINPNAHNYQNWTITTAPLCETDGEETGTCTRDVTHTTTRSVAALGHDWGWTLKAIAATETGDGKDTAVCNHDSNHTDTRFSGEYATGTAGLQFDLISINDGTDNAYRVHKGTATTATTIHIPAHHRSDANSPYLPVTAISNGTDGRNNNAFGGSASGTTNTTITTITFAKNSQLQIIGDYAFFMCTSLTSITIPTSITSINGRAFANCTSLTSITIPSSVTSIGNRAFMDSTSLASITIPTSVTIMDEFAFSGWTNTQTINVPFANANAMPSGWNVNWDKNYDQTTINAVIKYWNGTTWE